MEVPKDPYQSNSHYFSESSQEWLLIADLPLPYVRNVFLKHTNREGFANSPLAHALAVRLTPSRGMCKTLLATKGICSYWCPVKSEERKVRAMFYRLGKRLGVPVETRRVGEFLEATCEIVGEVVQVNFRANRKSTFVGRGR